MRRLCFVAAILAVLPSLVSAGCSGDNGLAAPPVPDQSSLPDLAPLPDLTAFDSPECADIGAVSKELPPMQFALPPGKTILDIGDVPVGREGTIPLLMRNNGGTAVTIDAVTSGAADFVEGASNPPTLAPFGTSQTSITFRPSHRGRICTTVTVSFTGLGILVWAPFAGYGT
jgi:hypothetical protein